MDIETKLRKLARTSYWQNIYNASTKNHGVQLFENSTNFSGLQVRFLYWLSIYDMLYTELDQQEDFLSEAVIADDVRCDAYLIARKKKYEYEWKKRKQEEKKNEIRTRHPNHHTKGPITPIEVELRRE